MDAEGMVHALEITHSLLKPDGLLIDIHPTSQPARVEVHRDGGVQLAGYVDDRDDFMDYIRADRALLEAEARALFRLEHQKYFPFLHHADTLTEMTDYITAEWSSAILPQETLTRAEQLIGQPGLGAEIVIRELIRITRYRALSPASSPLRP
jgi:hypothetical protein